MLSTTRILPLTVPITKQSPLPHPTYSSIAYKPLYITSVEISKHYRTMFSFIYSLLLTVYSVLRNAPKNSPTLNYSDLYRLNMFVSAADSSWFFTVTGLWYWVDNLCKCWYWRGFM